jgi:uncharacterized protein YbjQ (UPF0145 family)
MRCISTRTTAYLAFFLFTLVSLSAGTSSSLGQDEEKAAEPKDAINAPADDEDGDDKFAAEPNPFIDYLFIIVPIVLLLLGYVYGKSADRAHLQRLQKQLDEMDNMLVTNLKSFPLYIEGGPPPELVISEVVVATDYLKSFLASWRNLFGGEMKSYLSLLVRARLEVLVRLQAEAQQRGHNALCNVRFQTADIAGATGKRSATAVALIAYATAYTASS